MKFFILIIFYLISVSNETECKCDQILSEDDCSSFKYANCFWNTNTKKCIVSSTLINPNIQLTSYCGHLLTKSDCLNQSFQEKSIKVYPCGWVSYTCVTFPGCTAFLGKDDFECKSISNNCTSDGEQCIDIGLCSDYKTQTACSQLSIANKRCKYDSVLGCDTITSCENIQITTSTHADCIQILNTCTAKEDGGCLKQQYHCSDYTYQGACYITFLGQLCTWGDNLCVEKSCESAPPSYNTDEQCKSYMSGCTTKYGGGCFKTINCQDYKNLNSCKENSKGESCWWYAAQGKCIEQLCENAPPQEYLNESECKSFKSSCTSNSGYGCILNTGCTAITNKPDCILSVSGDQCYWNTTISKCLQKTCVNAPDSLVTYDQCNQYLSSCALGADLKGCEDKTCDNAALTMKTNEDCERYFPNNNCITKSGGGCKRNGECSTANIEVACKFDVHGAPCIWSETDSHCITKQCNKAPVKYISLEGCSTFFNNQCQLNQSKTGCEDKICSNMGEESSCKTDYNGKLCVWQGKCIEKLCSYANYEYDTYNECNEFSPNCTVANSGKGCMQLPLLCSAITTKEGCHYRKSIGIDGIESTKECAWNINACADKSCNTAPSELATSQDYCTAYLKGCYIQNDGTGCMLLPTCEKRGMQETCEAENNIDCIWDGQQCKYRSCTTAQVAGSKDALYSITVVGCNGYRLNSQGCPSADGKNCCTLNNTGDNCMDKPLLCSQLWTQANCQLKATKAGLDCYWVATLSKCVLKDCKQIVLNSYSNSTCNQYSCSVNEDSTQCMDLQSSCVLYQSYDGCRVDTFDNICAWKVGSDKIEYCGIQACEDMTADMYNSVGSCQGVKSSCTVIPVVNKSGCIPKKQYCSQYKHQYQCQSALEEPACIWNNERCYEKSGIKCNQIVLSSYSIQTCENIANYCKSDGNKCILKQCSDYTTISGIMGGVQVSTFEHCQAFNNNGCSINTKQTSCTDLKQTCRDYSVDNCSYTLDKNAKPIACKTDGTICFNQYEPCYIFDGISDDICKGYREFCISSINGTKCANSTCESKIGTSSNPVTDSICKLFDISCTAQTDGLKCMQILDDCTKYRIAEQCSKSNAGNCIFVVDKKPYQCIDSCEYIPNPKSLEDCQSYNQKCSINREKSKCIVIQDACSQYSKSIDNCYKSKQGYCAQDSSDSDCIYAQSLLCSSIYLGAGVTYSYDICNKMNSKCSNNGTSGCFDKTCINATISEYTHFSCSNWLQNQCTANANGTGCIKIEAECSSYSDQASCSRAVEGDCQFNNSVCLKQTKTCYDFANLALSNQTHEYCSAQMSSCTIAEIGGCQQTQDCPSYGTELQCNIDNHNNPCYWDNVQKICMLFTCNNIEKTAHKTHQACADRSSGQCTVSIDATKGSFGCMDLQACSQYDYEEQCHISSAEVACQWMELPCDDPNDINCGQCADRTCEDASKTILTDEECKNFSKNIHTTYRERCTVDVYERFPGSLVPQGCRSLTECVYYKITQQCIKDSNLQPCKWYSGACYLHQCNQAPDTIVTSSECSLFNAECTISKTGKGCQKRDSTCESQTKDQCSSGNQDGGQCYFDTIQNKCLTLTCSNQPVVDGITDQCSTVPNCVNVSSAGNQCKTKGCEDFTFKTDLECKNVVGMNQSCTTDGNRCILRTECEMALVQEACKTNYLGLTCNWIAATYISDAYCQTSKCDKAPKDYLSEIQCNAISPQCTSRTGGGCKEKTSCSSIEAEANCISYNEINCIWSNNSCISYDCKEYFALDHFTCKKNKPGCTISATGQCTQMQESCDLYIIQAACIETLSGVSCLWIQANSKCIKFTSCKDATLKTDAQCKQVSPYCTSNSTTCVAIQQCKKMPISSCKFGSDGTCMLVKTSENASSQTCMQFTSCSEAKYLSHSECQNSNSKCTTDGKFGCIYLYDQCLYYVAQYQCYQTVSGKVVKDGKVTSTGKCVWGNNLCRAETCIDISGATHSYCNGQLSTCTSNGSKCVDMQTCSNYTIQEACNYGYGSDGFCFWTQGNVCRKKSCSDVRPPSLDACKALTICVFDGTTCIDKSSSCESYFTATACSQGNQNNQPCYWTIGTSQCHQVTSCDQIGNDPTTCSQSLDCIYKLNTGCISKTCQTLYETSHSCTYFKKLQNQVNYCQILNGQCQEASDLSKLDKNQCMTNSNYTMTFNSSSGICQACETSVGPFEECYENDEGEECGKKTYSPVLNMIYLLALFILN